MYYIVIYDKVSKKIYRVIPQSDKIVCIGYSDNCAQTIMQERPKEDHV